MDYRSVIESKYNRQNWQALLSDIFRNKIKFWETPLQVPVDEKMARNAIYIGKITLADNRVIAIYEVELSDGVIIERNRAGIRNLLLSSWRGMGCSGAFMFCFRQNEAALRFSYVSEAFAFTEEGSLTKESTDTKRYTYLMGEGHRSRTAIQQFEELKKSTLDLKAITKAFSVEALSDLFFKEYKKQYEDIIEFITGKRMVKVANKWKEQVTGQPCREIMQEFCQFSDPEKAVRDYVKKLMGRLVFIQFLQKKGWMGCSAGKSWNDGDKEFVQNLFANTSHKNTFVDDVLEPLFNDINTKRTDDITSSPNVGTGIKIPYLNGGLFEKDDYDKTNFQLPAKYMKNLLDFFASYNFTIDENDPDDAEIGVDPEMLGRIFENLLEDNKDKGAFYTPKEIVQYMCRESLIAYLQTDVNDDQTKDAIRQFVTTYDASILSKELKESVDQKLKDVKICDPAIGSGAFPMGMLRELYACRKAIEGIDEETAVSIKTHIIQNNIYGVDIEKGAVDIARLRFWLALIVDEKNPHALPNMDFKIMQGNSLLEQYQGVDLSTVVEKKREGTSDVYGVIVDKLRLKLRNLLSQYYDCTDHKEKKNLRKEITDNVKQQLSEQGITINFGDLDLAGNDNFFLWHTWFYDVFSQGGFDIVIGNPPYFVYEGNNKEELPLLRKQKELEIAFGGKLNAYKIFLASSLNKLVKKNGLNSFIFQNSFMADLQAVNLRKHVFDNCQILTIDSFPERDNKKKRVFESVKMSVCILLIRNANINNSFVVNIWDDKDKSSGIITHFTKDEISEIDPISLTIPRLKEEAKPIILKMIKQRAITIKCCEGELNVTSHRPFFSDDPSLPIIMKGAGIQKYYYTFDMSQGRIEHLKEKEYLKKYGSSEKAHHHETERIVMQGMTGANDKIRLVMTIVPNGMYLGHSCKYILPSEEVSMKCLLGFMNSKLANFFFRCFSTNSNVNGYEIEAIPICNIPKDIAEKLEDSVTIIMSSKVKSHSTNTAKEETFIDLIVYQLYDLTYDEVLIVDPETKIKREEYENYKSE